MKIILIKTFSILILTGCQDIFDKDISGEIIKLNAPTDSLISTELSYTFWWSEIEGAKGYKIQIVEGNFDNIINLVIDSTIYTGKFHYTFSKPGNYQWRVKAFNNASETPYSIHTLIIDSSLVLSGQQVILITPSGGSYLNTTNVFFDWYPVVNATAYRLEIYNNTWGTTLAVPSQVISFDSVSVDLSEGTYVWGIQAINSFSASNFTTNSFMIDTTKPATPVLINPTNNQQIPNASINFSWSISTDNGSPIFDSIYIAGDSLFNNIIVKEQGNNMSYTDSLGLGTFYWRVKAFDRAGNESNYSSYNKLIIY
jgi:hypothetical protein